MSRILIFQDKIQYNYARPKFPYLSVVSLYSCICIISISTGRCCLFRFSTIIYPLESYCKVNDFTTPRSTSTSPSVAHNHSVAHNNFGQYVKSLLVSAYYTYYTYHSFIMFLYLTHVLPRNYIYCIYNML